MDKKFYILVLVILISIVIKIVIFAKDTFFSGETKIALKIAKVAAQKIALQKKTKNCVKTNYIDKNICDWDHWSDMYSKCSLDEAGFAGPMYIKKIQNKDCSWAELDNLEKKDTPKGLWYKTPSGKIIDTDELKKNLYVSPEDGYHVRIGSNEYFELFFDDNKFEELNSELTAKDPLKFVDTKKYPDRLKAAQKKTGLKDAVRTAVGKSLGKENVSPQNQRCHLEPPL